MKQVPAGLESLQIYGGPGWQQSYDPANPQMPLGGYNLLDSLFNPGKVARYEADYANYLNQVNANYEFDRNYWMWQEQNSYNHPLQQMQRYAEAGLNPRLVYGSSGNAGNASGGPTYHRGTVMPRPGNTTLADVAGLIMPILSQFQDIRQKDANIQNTKADTIDKLMSNEVRSAGLGYETMAEPEVMFNRFTTHNLENRFLRQYARDSARRIAPDVFDEGAFDPATYQRWFARYNADFRNTVARAIGLEMDNELAQYNIQDRQVGLNPNSSDWLSTGLRYANRMGNSFSDILPSWLKMILNIKH